MRLLNLLTTHLKVIFSSLVLIGGFSFYASGQAGDALDFDGSDDYVDCGDIGNAEGGQKLTISAWVNPSSLNQETIITKWNHSSNDVWGLRIENSSEIRFFVASSLSDNGINRLETTNANLSTGKWVHITAVYDGTKNSGNRAKVYKNGVLLNNTVNGTIPSSMTSTNNANVWIGDFENLSGMNFQGKIDEVRIWDRARTASQIRDSMCLELTGNEQGLVGYWKFDDGSGPTATAHAGSNDGTLGGGVASAEPSWVTSGAVLGDDVIHSYASGVTIPFSSSCSGCGDNMKIESISSADGIYLVRVDNQPNNLTGTDSIEQVSQERYWIVKTVDDNSGGAPTYNISYSYGGNSSLGHPGWSHEPTLTLVSRENNASGSWSPSGPSQDKSNNTLSLTGQTGTEYALATTNSTDPLPVELSAFQANKESESVNLNWRTASETNNSHFIVQRKTSGRWENIGRVRGHGTSTEPHSYRFRDREPYKGVNYYRLKQVDFDGSFEYSGIKAVEFTRELNVDLRVLQNPVGQQLNVELNTSRDQSYQYFVLNLQGKPVKEGEWNLARGRHDLSISMQDLPSGAYYLRIQGAEKQMTRKIIK